MRDIDLQRQCIRAIELAQANSAALVPYGISGADIETLVTSLESYRKQREEQQLKLAESKAAREMLYGSFDKADEILREEIDPLVELLQTTDVEFYNHYQAARVTKDLGGHITKTDKTDTSAPNTPEPEGAALPTNA